MGAWGAGPFDNDDAGDFVWEVTEAASPEVVRNGLAVEAEVEAPDGSIALAAAEVVAAALGRPLAGLEDELVAWVAAHAQEFTPADASAAQVAVAHVAGPGSELADLWAEAGGDDEAAWRASIDDVQRRLAQP